MPYEALVGMVERRETIEVVGDSGTKYSVQVSVVWDDFRGGDLRVICAIDAGGWDAFFPKTDDFIMSPNGDVRR